MHKPNIVILTETRIIEDREFAIIPTFGYAHHASSLAEGQSGGILVLWNNELNIELVGQTRQEIHLRVQVCTQPISLLFAIYCLPYFSFKHILWNNLHSISQSINLPFLVGDFKIVIIPNEKLGGKPVPFKPINMFTKNLNSCNLNDLGFHGSPYTWSNNRYSNKRSLIKERIDRFLGNDKWMDKFPDSKNFHLHSYLSDHIPIILNTSSYKNKRPFRFESMWYNDPSFHNVENNSWNCNQNYDTCVKTFTQNVKTWNKF